jgi:UDP-3-O-[3-hydroxymyristoyl] glucosamine N-acyltransferase
MKFSRPKSLKEVAEFLVCEFVGDPEFEITGINEIHRVESGDIVFVDHPKYYDKALKSEATVILIDRKVECPEGKALLVSSNPFSDFNRLTKAESPESFEGEREQSNIHPSAVVSPDAKIGEGCFIGPGVVIYSRVVIGDRVRIHANSVIGADAFYYKKRESGFEKMHTCGGVVIEDDVEIGAMSTIDSGVTAITSIGRGTKIDNHVHVGHDTVVGKNCLIAAQVGIAGCVNIEDNVTLWGQVGIPSSLTVGKGAVLLGQSGIMKSVEGGKTYFGSPADEVRTKYRELALLRKLPKLMNLRQENSEE